jgi:hypothetical protein
MAIKVVFYVFAFRIISCQLSAFFRPGQWSHVVTIFIFSHDEITKILLTAEAGNR